MFHLGVQSTEKGITIFDHFPDHGLDESAIRTIASKWRFRPGTYKGKPVDVQIDIEVAFSIY